MKRLVLYVLAIICLFTIASPTPTASASAASPTAGTVSTSMAQLNVRSGPSTARSVIGNIPRGGTVMLYGQSGGWWRVRLPGGKEGYCSASYIKEISGSAARFVAASGLNVRSGPSSSYAVQTTLSKGTTAVRLSTSGDFAKIVYDGTKVGYVNASYLQTAGGSSGGSSSSVKFPAISLRVPNYKQMDSRWASVTLGERGKTIENIGCATTALAMTESYRTGRSITPDIMKDDIRYMAGGSLYWPSNYKPVDELTYSELYAKLKEGVPVIVGCLNASGGSHFVVVTGFTGGNSLSASGFTINDPGSNTRTTLSQFMTVYPTLYRRLFYTN